MELLGANVAHQQYQDRPVTYAVAYDAAYRSRRVEIIEATAHLMRPCARMSLARSSTSSSRVGLRPGQRGT